MRLLKKSWLLLAVFCGMGSICLGGGYQKQQFIQKKVQAVQFLEIERQIEYLRIPVSGYTPQYYYSVGDPYQYRQEYKGPSHCDSDTIADKVIDKLLRSGYIQSENDKPVPPPANDDTVPQTSLDNQVLDIFKKNRCVECHSRDGVVSLDLNTAGRAEVHARVLGFGLEEGQERMPKDGPYLTQEEIKIIHQWMLEEAKREISQKK